MIDTEAALSGKTPQEFLELARQYYGLRARGDCEPALEFFADHATYRLIGARHLIPAAGMRIGKAEIREAWRAFDVDFEMLSFEIDDLVFDAPRIAYISWRMTLRNRGTGVKIDLEGVDRARFEQFKIVEWVRYFDTALLAALRQGG